MVRFTIRDLFWAVLVTALFVYALSMWVRNEELHAKVAMFEKSWLVEVDKREKAEQQHLSRYGRAAVELYREFAATRDELQTLSTDLTVVVRLLDSNDVRPIRLKRLRYKLATGRDALGGLLDYSEFKQTEPSVSESH